MPNIVKGAKTGTSLLALDLVFKGGFGMLSSEGRDNLKLLKDLAAKTWEKNVIIINENVIQIPVDAFVIEMKLYNQFKVLLEYETGTFAFKLWTGEKYEYLDGLTDKKIFYGFDSMLPANTRHNFEVLDTILCSIK